MNEGLYIGFGIVSLVVFIATLVLSIKANKSKERGKRVISALHIFTIGVFLSTVLIFLPVYYVGYDFGDNFAIIRPALISIHHTFRVFILDGEFDIIRDSVSGFGEPCHEMFSLYSALLYVLAPILTFGNVLSLFKNIKNEMRFFFCRRRPFYIFSELNKKSITLAESIVEAKKDIKPMIVFTDVFEQENEDDYELLLRAHDIVAILLRRDIARVNVKRKMNRVEFFLIGENESENVEQTIKLNSANNVFKNRAIFLFSSGLSAGYIIDSLNKGSNVISESLAREIDNNSNNVVYEDWLDSGNYDMDECYYLRRINSIDRLAASVLTSPTLLTPLLNQIKEKHKISLLLLGIGEYGKAFLKNALWLYQIYNFPLEITVVDKAAERDVVGILKHECPEIRLNERVDEYGGENYHIRLKTLIDFETSGFEDLLLSEENRSWVSEIQLAIVALGEDDINIETSVELRRIFDIAQEVNDKSRCLKDVDEIPLIYSIVYDEKKVSNLTNGNGNPGLVDYKGNSYHIRFIGSLKSQYSYGMIDEMRSLEKEAIKIHFEWIKTASKLRDYYENEKYNDDKDVLTFRRTVDEIFAEGNVSWGDEFLFVTDSKGNRELSPSEITKSVSDYMNYEYFRESSLAKAMHKKHIAKIFEVPFKELDVEKSHREDLGICMCEKCTKTRMNEHMRWNAYMRSTGWRYGAKRCVRAKIHPDLVVWDKLPRLEKYKD